MPRKTIAVEDVKQLINGMLQNSEDSNQAGRDAAISILERVLMDTGNYRGFQYLTQEDMKASENGLSVGMNTDCNGELLPADAGRFAGVDHTRVRFY